MTPVAHQNLTVSSPGAIVQAPFNMWEGPHPLQLNYRPPQEPKTMTVAMPTGTETKGIPDLTPCVYGLDGPPRYVPRKPPSRCSSRPISRPSSRLSISSSQLKRLLKENNDQARLEAQQLAKEAEAMADQKARQAEERARLQIEQTKLEAQRLAEQSRLEAQQLAALADQRAKERNDQLRCEMTRLLKHAAADSVARATQQAAVAFRRQVEESNLAHRHHQLFTAPPPVSEPVLSFESKQQRSKSEGDLSSERNCDVSGAPRSIDPVPLTGQRSEGKKAALPPNWKSRPWPLGRALALSVMHVLMWGPCLRYSVRVAVCIPPGCHPKASDWRCLLP